MILSTEHVDVELVACEPCCDCALLVGPNTEARVCDQGCELEDEEPGGMCTSTDTWLHKCVIIESDTKTSRRAFRE